MKASTTIGLFGDVDTSSKTNKSADAAKSQINEARLGGIEPTLAVSAYEYAGTLTTPFEEISQYSYARMVAKTSLVLNSYAVPAAGKPVKPTVTPFVYEAIPSATPAATNQTAKKVPALEAIAAIAVILVVRRLNRS